MPWFRERPIDEITRADVQRWLTALHATPAAAARSVPILSVILRQAEVYGHRPKNTNPCTGVRRYRQRARERFVTTEEAPRLGAALAARENTSAVPRSSPPPVAARVSPERIPRSSLPDYREGHCFSVTARPDRERCGCRRPHARWLDRLPRMGRSMFLESKGTGPLSGGTLDRSWRALREEAVLHNLRLHDLRHSYASFALRPSETVLTIGVLLRHRDPASTLRYTHCADALARNAVGAVGASLGVDGWSRRHFESPWKEDGPPPAMHVESRRHGNERTAPCGGDSFRPSDRDGSTGLIARPFMRGSTATA